MIIGADFLSWGISESTQISGRPMVSKAGNEYILGWSHSSPGLRINDQPEGASAVALGQKMEPNGTQWTIPLWIFRC